MAVHLKPFDPSREFVAQRFFRLFGRLYQKGEGFDKGSVDQRKLAQLYETRHITYEGEEQVRVFPPRTAKERQNLRAIAERATGPEGTQLPSRVGQTEEQVLTEENEALAQKLSNGNTHDDLWKKAIGIKGVRKAMTKIEIARALVTAGRAGDGAA